MTTALTTNDIDMYVRGVGKEYEGLMKTTVMNPELMMTGADDNKKRAMQELLDNIPIYELVKFDAQKLRTLLITKGGITGGASRIRSSHIGDKSGSARGKTTSLVDIVAKAKSRHETRTRK